MQFNANLMGNTNYLMSPNVKVKTSYVLFLPNCHNVHIHLFNRLVCKVFSINCKEQFLQVNIVVTFDNLGGVFNFIAYTFVRRYNASGKRQDKGTGRREKEPGSNGTNVSTIEPKQN